MLWWRRREIIADKGKGGPNARTAPALQPMRAERKDDAKGTKAMAAKWSALKKVWRLRLARELMMAGEPDEALEIFLQLCEGKNSEVCADRSLSCSSAALVYMVIRCLTLFEPTAIFFRQEMFRPHRGNRFPSNASGFHRTVLAPNWGAGKLPCGAHSRLLLESYPWARCVTELWKVSATSHCSYAYIARRQQVFTQSQEEPGEPWTLCADRSKL